MRCEHLIVESYFCVKLSCVRTVSAYELCHMSFIAMYIYTYMYI